jgi:peptidyl-prolyl cis-trans isomerase C
MVTVNGEPITTDIFSVYYGERMRQSQGQNTPELRARALDELVKMVVLTQEAENQQLDRQPAVAAALAFQRDQLLSRLAIQEFLQKSTPSDEEMKKLYDEQYENYSGTEYKASHILVKTNEEAATLITELGKGGDFAELAKEHSTGPTGPKGGELGWFDAEQMVPAFSDAVKGMEKGAFSQEPVQTQFGWHVILLQDTRDAEPPTFEEVKPQLATQLQQTAVARYVAELRQKAKVELNEKFIKPPVEAAPAKETPETPEEK